MGDKVSLKVSTEKANQALERAISLLSGSRKDKLFKEIAKHLVGTHKDRFEEEKGPDGSPWEPLKTPRRSSKGTDKILQNTRRLFKSITFALGSDHIEIGTNVEYAIYHQFGKGVPKREFIGLDSKEERDIIKIVEFRIKEALG